MKNIYLYFIICICLLVKNSNAQTGYLDTTFSGDGIVVYSADQGSDAVTSLAIQPDGKILAVGTSANYFRLARFYANGSLDSLFAQRMLQNVVIGTSYACIIQPDSEMIVVGAAASRFHIARYLNTGFFSPTFGSVGQVSIDFGPGGSDAANAVALQNDGKIVVDGVSTAAMDTDGNIFQRFAVARLDSNGTPDSTFSDDGKLVTYVTSTNSVAYAVAVQTDGKIVAAGKAQTGAHDFEVSVALVRYNTDGSLDTTFGTGGIVVTNFDSVFQQAYAMVIQPDNKILIAGNVGGASTGFLVARYNTNGTLDTSFNGGHSVGLYGAAKSIALQTDGKIVTAGWSTDSHYDFGIMRWKANGTPDNSFGSAGILETVVGTDDAEANAVAIQPDGKIVAAGYSRIPLGYTDFALVRYLPSFNVGIIDFTLPDNTLLVYPNPLHENNTLEYTLNTEEIISIKMFDMQGKAVGSFIENAKQEPGLYKQAINLPGSLPPGGYILTISSDAGQKSVRLVR